MQHPDEGTIHSWLDGALSPDESARLEAHVKECPQCAAAVAEARGFIAASSRILTALDNAPRGVIPAAAPKKRIDPMVWRVAATVLVVAAGTLVVVRDRASDERPISAAADRGTILEKRASLPERASAAMGPAQIVADATIPKAAASKAPASKAAAIELARKTLASDSGSGIRARENNESAKAGVMMQAGQSAAGSGYVGGAAPTTQPLLAPSHVAGAVAMDAATESEPLKVVGTPRRIGVRVTLYEVAPGDTVTLTEPMFTALNSVVVTGTATASVARQATGKSAEAPSKARANAPTVVTTPDSQRTDAILSTSSASAPAPAPQIGVQNGLNSIAWTDPATGNTLTLTGRISKARLQEIKIRIERERATAAAKKNP